MLQSQPGMGAGNRGGAFPHAGTDPCPALGQVLPLRHALVWPPLIQSHLPLQSELITSWVSRVYSDGVFRNGVM